MESFGFRTNLGSRPSEHLAVLTCMDARGEGGEEIATEIEWEPIVGEPEALIEDVRKVRANPLIASDVPIYGSLMDTEAGQIVEVPEAIDIGTGHLPSNWTFVLLRAKFQQLYVRLTKVFIHFEKLIQI